MAIENVLKMLARAIASKPNVLDTGWRKVSTPALSRGYLLVRRINNACYINVAGGVADTCEIERTQRGKRSINLWDAPKGYQSAAAVIESVTVDGYNQVGMWLLTSKRDLSVLQMRGVPAESYALLRPQMLVYVTDDPFPSSPAGVEVR